LKVRLTFAFTRLWYVTIGLLFSVVTVQAYPEFIGYGYTSCMTCHYNGQGSGPLTDYGRALWSGEIASRLFYPKSMTDEAIANQSGFLGSTELPYWFRPHMKYRAIGLRMQPGSASQDITRYYHMQADVGTTLQDRDGKYVAVLTWGRMVPPSQYLAGTTNLNRFLAREYYARVEVAKTWWVYVGLMEKVFGIRNIDHTSYQRTYQGFNVANDDTNGIAQSQGIILQKETEHGAAFLNYFIGNPYDDADYKQSGFSGMVEYDVGENKRLGASVLSAKSNVLTKQMAAVHYRQQIFKGSALLAEYGLIQDQDNSGNTYVGSYNLVQALVGIVRGYNLKLSLERYNKEFHETVPENWRYSFGFVVFPAPRFEFRLEAINERAVSSQLSSQDSWVIEGQVHVSL
jgi:hypothetical protein